MSSMWLCCRASSLEIAEKISGSRVRSGEDVSDIYDWRFTIDDFRRTEAGREIASKIINRKS
jgi:hypothetical protein